MWTMRHPPSRVPSAMAVWQDSTTQSGTWKAAALAVGVEQGRDDAHGLLGVVAAVPEGVERGRDELQAPEQPVHGVRRRADEDPRHGQHQHQRQGEAEGRREHDRGAGGDDARPDDHARPGLGDPRTQQAADEGVRARRRDAGVPGDQVPGDRAAERPQDHPVVDRRDVDDARARPSRRRAGRTPGRPRS